MTLGVALETFSTWDAGRRTAPEAIVGQARSLKAKRPSHDQVPLQVLADELHVHVRTLRAAAHDGRLAATFGARPFFGKLTATATREAAAQFMGEVVSPDLRTRAPPAGARVQSDRASKLRSHAGGLAASDRPQPAAVGGQGPRSQQGGRLPMGKRHTQAVPRLLAESPAATATLTRSEALAFRRIGAARR